MLVYKEWAQIERGGLVVYQWKGWFLFGFIPLTKRRFVVSGFQYTKINHR